MKFSITATVWISAGISFLAISSGIAALPAHADSLFRVREISHHSNPGLERIRAQFSEVCRQFSDSHRKGYVISVQVDGSLNHPEKVIRETLRSHWLREGGGTGNRDGISVRPVFKQAQVVKNVFDEAIMNLPVEESREDLSAWFTDLLMEVLLDSTHGWNQFIHAGMETRSLGGGRFLAVMDADLREVLILGSEFSE